MGMANVNAVVSEWMPRLNGNALKVLLRMAQRSLDAPLPGQPARRYWAGWEDLAEALGKEPNKTAQNAVSVAVAELIAAGAIARVKSGVPGRNAQYAVNVSPQHSRKTRENTPGKVGTTLPEKVGAEEGMRIQGGGAPAPEKATTATPLTVVPDLTAPATPERRSGDPLTCPRHPEGNPNDVPCRGCRAAREARKAAAVADDERKRRPAMPVDTPCHLHPGQTAAKCPHCRTADRETVKATPETIDRLRAAARSGRSTADAPVMEAS